MKVKMKSLTVPEEESLWNGQEVVHELKAPDSGSAVRGSDLTVAELMALEHMSLRLRDT